MHTIFTVGELAKLNHISKQTLIFYDKKGVFQPKIVDETNGYRYYTAEQLEVLDSILILKEMGLSLDEIRDFMDNRSVESTLILIKEQLAINKKKISQLKLVSKRLERKIKGLEHYCAGEGRIVIYESSKAEFLAIEPVYEPKGLLSLDIALKRLLNRAGEEHYPHHYQVGAMIPVAELLVKRYIYADYAVIPVDISLNGDEFHKKPVGHYVRGFHTGSYHNIGKTYEKLLRTVDAKGYVPFGYAYEYCILDSLTSKVTEDYVTEIQIPIRQK